MAGTFMLVEGDREVKDWLLVEGGRVDDWLYELADDVAFFASDRIRQRAPGGIAGLVDVDLVNELEPGYFEAIAGVGPDITEETFHSGFGSDPADYPVFVEEGTGVFGEFGTPIETIPGHVMGPIPGGWAGDDVFFFATRIQGQRGQHYVRGSFEDTVGWVPTKIEIALPELGRRA